MKLGQGEVGSVLAAVGTALPETMIPIVAVLAAPFLLATLAMFVTGAVAEKTCALVQRTGSALGRLDERSGGEGRDDIFGGNETGPESGDKALAGGPSNDDVFGGLGDDALDGGPGADSLSGGTGRDQIGDGEVRGGPGDALSGGDGDDILYPVNDPAGEDAVDCGAAFDVVFADRADVIDDDCERVRYRSPGN